MVQRRAPVGSGATLTINNAQSANAGLYYVRVTDDITTAGIFYGVAPVFQTYSFDAGFSALVRVELPLDGWSLDNLVLSVPEPGSSSFLVLGAALAALRRFKRKNNHAEPASKCL